MIKYCRKPDYIQNRRTVCSVGLSPTARFKPTRHFDRIKKYSDYEGSTNSRCPILFTNTNISKIHFRGLSSPNIPGIWTRCLSVRASFHMRREEKPARCHWMLYCTYDMLNMFRTLLCPSSGALDYTCVIAAYGVQCLVAGCRGSGAGQQGVRPGWGMLLEQHPYYKCNKPFSGI